MPRAYSYIRFSTPEQQKGRSLDRQIEAAITYASKHDLDLDTTTTYRDLGVSGFRGQNRDEALGAFINAVTQRRIPSGSYLLVESLDRLSRDRIDIAFSQLCDIIRLGVTVVTLQDGNRYDAESLGDLSKLIISLTIMSRANEESETKSRRMKDAWRHKKERARRGESKLTKTCPAWLQLSEDGSEFEAIEERASVVQRVFKMTLGGYGMGRIARQFNDECVPVFTKSNGWHHSYITKMLNNDAVIGVFHPMREDRTSKTRKRVKDGEPIVDYYPPVVERAEFLKVKQMKEQRKKARGRTGRVFSNLLSGLLVCGTCGGAVNYVGKGGPPKNRPYLSCSNARRHHGDCNAPSWRYETYRRDAVGRPQ